MEMDVTADGGARSHLAVGEVSLSRLSVEVAADLPTPQWG